MNLKNTYSTNTNKRTDWEQMAKEVFTLIKRLRKKPNKNTLFRIDPGAAINSYREGDLTFTKAIKLIKIWKNNEVKEAKNKMLDRYKMRTASLLRK